MAFCNEAALSKTICDPIPVDRFERGLYLFGSYSLRKKMINKWKPIWSFNNKPIFPLRDNIGQNKCVTKGTCVYCIIRKGCLSFELDFDSCCWLLREGNRQCRASFASRRLIFELKSESSSVSDSEYVRVFNVF